MISLATDQTKPRRLGARGPRLSSEEQQKVFVLYREGLSLRKISKRMGVARGTVTSILLRGKVVLSRGEEREKLEEERKDLTPEEYFALVRRRAENYASAIRRRVDNGSPEITLELEGEIQRRYEALRKQQETDKLRGPLEASES